mgnify:CR=1 FL=1
MTKKREIINGEECFLISGARFYSISDTFECGQCFRAEKTKDENGYAEYATVIGNKILRIGQKTPGELYVFDTDEDELISTVIPYLSIDRDYEAIRADINSRTDSDWLKKAGECARGIAILRQEPWEALLSFIISQNNNIPRIKSLIRALCERLGEPIDTSDMLAHGARATEYAFPTPEAICAAGVDVLRELKTGFRAKYIYDAACRVCDGRLSFSEIYAAPTAEASAMLEQISGVGPKVAACTLLFGFGKLDAFPVDVWIRRVIEKYGFDPAALGDFAGLAQQYLFYAEREESK